MALLLCPVPLLAIHLNTDVAHPWIQLEMNKPLKDMLDKYWPSLYCSFASTYLSGKGHFWAHEWGNMTILSCKVYKLAMFTDICSHQLIP
ncbi:unnamed protein product [Urochloa humidicola]